MTEELKEKLLKNVGEKARNVFLEKQEKESKQLKISKVKQSRLH